MAPHSCQMVLSVPSRRIPPCPPFLTILTPPSLPPTLLLQLQLKVDVVVVGAGVAGLSAAAELRRRNSALSVLIIEANHSIGGRFRVEDFGNPFGQQLTGARFVHGRDHQLFKWHKKRGLLLQTEHLAELWHSPGHPSVELDYDRKDFGCPKHAPLQKALKYMDSLSAEPHAPRDDSEPTCIRCHLLNAHSTADGDALIDIVDASLCADRNGSCDYCLHEDSQESERVWPHDDDFNYFMTPESIAFTAQLLGDSPLMTGFAVTTIDQRGDGESVVVHATSSGLCEKVDPRASLQVLCKRVVVTVPAAMLKSEQAFISRVHPATSLCTAKGHRQQHQRKEESVPSSSCEVAGDSTGVEERILFAPPISEEKQAAIDALFVPPMGKVFLKFTKPIWNERFGNVIASGGVVPEYWVHSAFAKGHTHKTSKQQKQLRQISLPILTGFLASKWLRALQAADVDSVERVCPKQFDGNCWDLLAPWQQAATLAILDQLGAIFSLEPETIPLTHAVFCNWGDVPYIRAGYSTPSLTAAMRQSLCQPEGHIYFAGEAISREQDVSLMGAIKSGKEAAREVLKSLADS